MLSKPPERITPTVRSVSSRTRMLSSSAARTSLAASPMSVMSSSPSPMVSKSTYGVTAGSWAGLPHPWWPGGISLTSPPEGTSAFNSDATYR